MSEATRSRQIALKAVSLVNSGVAIQAALDGVLAAGGLSPRDRHFCSDLVYGYFRNKIRLDFILDKFLKNPSKTSRIARSILGLGLYSLLFQDSTPAWAAIDEAVKLAKKKLDVGGAKVVNGVLRNISRSLDDIREPEWHEKNSPDKWSGLAVFYSIPPGLAVLWRRVYGEEAALNLMRVSSARPWTGIRLNSASPLFAALKKDLDGLVAAGLGRNLGDGGYAFAKAPAPLLERGPGSLFGEGVFSFQAAGSQMVIRELGLRDWREPVWDCCAGAGGKTLALLDAGVPVTLASDPSPSRPRAMLAECRRLKIAAPGLVRASALAPPLTVWRGNILADVPCSGSGVLARRPDLRLKKPDIAAFARLQLGILESCASLLQPGKELAYITCSRNPAENEELAARFLKKHPEMEQTRSWQTPVEHPWLEGMGGVVLRKKTRGSR